MKGIRTESPCRCGSFQPEDEAIEERKNIEGRQAASMTPRMAVIAQSTARGESIVQPTTGRRRGRHGKGREERRGHKSHRGQKSR